MQGAEVATALEMDADVIGRQLVGEPAGAGKAVGRIVEQRIADAALGAIAAMCSIGSGMMPTACAPSASIDGRASSSATMVRSQ